MATVIIDGRGTEAERGTLLSQLLGLEQPCGGHGRCGKCRVWASGMLSPVTEAERRLLSGAELEQGLRLACCARVAGDCTVATVREQGNRICLSGRMAEFTLDPWFSRFGAAVDIGTTTLAAALYDPMGKELATAAAQNPQARWGADVISRIEAALAGQLEALGASIREAVNDLLRQLAAQAGTGAEQIEYLVITGNTTMLYLLCGYEPEELSHAPFQAEHLFGQTCPAESLGLVCAGAQVYLPRCVSAFVGADIITALLASGICAGEQTHLLVDIGTNGEAALWHDGALSCCSTAAGPAFEGAGLSMGMLGRDGAVDHVALEQGQLRAHVIGGGEPRGICGSGVIDAVACLLEQEMLDETGLLEEDPALIAGAVSLSQKDIRMIQLAKSAICAGLRTLLHSAGVDSGSVKNLAIAGGFGSYIEIANAGRIGLILPELADRASVLGNAALSGAAMILLSRELARRSETLARQARTVDLSTSPVFMEEYTTGMFFGEE